MEHGSGTLVLPSASAETSHLEVSPKQPKRDGISNQGVLDFCKAVPTEYKNKGASPRLAEHLKRINSLPQVKANHFKKGHKNSPTSIWVKVQCPICGKTFSRTEAYIAKFKNIACSFECRWKNRTAPRTNLCASLYAQGMTYKEIAKTLGITIGSASGMIYQARLRKDIGSRVGQGKAFVRSKLPRTCELCGYSRIVEVAHIIPVRAGGKYALDNCYSLCPNCHHLFDHDALTPEEQSKLRKIHASRNQRTTSPVHADVCPSTGKGEEEMSSQVSCP